MSHTISPSKLPSGKFYVFGGDELEVRTRPDTPIFHENALYKFIGYEGLRYSKWIQEVTFPDDAKIVPSWPDCKTEITADCFIRGIKTDVPQQVYMDLVAYEGQFLCYVPKERRTLDMCLVALARNPTCISSIPDDILTYNMCLTAVTECGYTLSFIPLRMRTKEVCTTAVRTHGEAIFDVPRHVLTEEMCVLAVTDDWTLLEHIPDVFQTEQVRLTAEIKQVQSREINVN